jgi:hypothetical protein
VTGYLGGAVATHVRAGQGLSEILFFVVFGALLWGGLVLRMNGSAPFFLSKGTTRMSGAEEADMIEMFYLREVPYS